jgi:hypothetical protein
MSIIDGEMLNDEHVKLRSTAIEGTIFILQWPTLHSQSKKEPLPESKQALQIIHSRGNHWIAVSTVNADDGTVCLRHIG